MHRIARAITLAVLSGALVTAGGLPAEAQARHTVTIIGTSEMPATYTVAGNGIVVQKENRTTYKRVFAKTGYYYSISVSSWDGGKVACKILVDGKVKRNKHASGSYSSVNCTL